jgi:programmed cell death protein 5
MPVDMQQNNANRDQNNDLKDNYKEQYMKQIEVMRQIDLMLKQILSSEARERLSNIRLINQELYMKVAQYLIQAYQQGAIRGIVDDNMLKQILSQLQPKRNIKIRRK